MPIDHRTRHATIRRGALWPVVLALAACGPDSRLAEPDQPLPALVLEAPFRVSSPDGDQVIVLTEQSVRRTEKNNRTEFGRLQERSRYFSLRRHVLWSFDPATLQEHWRHTLQEVRPAWETVAPRIVASSAQAIWWQGPGAGAVGARDGLPLRAPGPAPEGGRPVDWATAAWQFHTGDVAGPGGPLRIPGADTPLHATDPAGRYLLHVPSPGNAEPSLLRVERVSEDGHSLWIATLPVARLHGLVVTRAHLVFLGMKEAGKVPGTQHDAQGSHVLVSVNVPSGTVVALNIGEMSVTVAPERGHSQQAGPAARD